MKAVVMSGISGRKFVTDKPVPQAKEDEVIVEVRAIGINPVDYKLQAMALFKPGQILGYDVAGVVKEVGNGVKDFAKGDRVFGSANGSYAEFAQCKAGSLAKVPDFLSFVQCAALPVTYQTAYKGLTQFGYQKGQSLLIIGASGGAGTAAVTLGRAIGGPEANIIAVCSGKNEQLVKDLGANQVIDYTKETPLAALGKESVDFVYDAASFSGGGENYFGQGKELIKKDGMFVALNGALSNWVRLLTGTQAKNQKIFLADQKGDDLRAIVKLLKEQNAEPVIGKVLEFNAENVEEAIADLHSRRTKGKIILTIGSQD
eukprot:CAMPEP_0171500712 /NCGR_PEP_ID=MMETSP0958-20121227/9137_1 /TAXON_ID=87120 /ORGANISM="Aurantiochytrium limacinum, Strain ATCCMYA-1381" /LENGTH=315 /DNA_ID=CAMNT_0012035411 /DNA_START=109 /DNA_END=1056 /DNA_ORIENTATION=+